MSSPTVCDVQYESDLAGASGTTRTVTFTRPVKTGRALLVCVFWKTNVTISSVTDSASNTYADSGAGRLARPTDGYLQVYGAKNVTGGALTVTVTFSASATSIYIICLELILAHATTLFGATATGTATSGSTVTSGTFTPSSTRGAILTFLVGDAASTCVPGAIGGTTALRAALPASAGLGVAILPYTASLGSNITAAMDAGATITKAAMIAVEVQAATAVYASQIVVGQRNDGMFTLGGQPQFLCGPTYFDALDWWHSDLTAMRDAGYTHCRILLDKEWDDGGTGTESVFSATGTIRAERMAKIHALLLVLDSYGMAAEVVIHVADSLPNTASWITNATDRASAVTNAVTALKSHTNILWDIINEANYGTAYDDLALEAQPLINAALAAHPAGVFCVSMAGGLEGSPWGLTPGTEAPVSTDFAAFVATGLPGFAYHEGREGDWWRRIFMRGQIVKKHLRDVQGRPDMPVYFNEPARVGSIFTGGSNPTADQMVAAAVYAARSGISGYVAHSGASFQMATSTMVSQFTADELDAFWRIPRAVRQVTAILPQGRRANFPKPVLRG